MKVLFTFGGLPHYLVKLLNQLNTVENLDVIVAIPKSRRTSTLGAGVEQSSDNVGFKVFHLPEKKAWYKKPFLFGLDKLIANEKPNVVVTMWPYIFGFTFSLKLRKLMKTNGIKLIMKEIPFMVPRYDDAERYFKSQESQLNENLEERKIGLAAMLKYKMLTKIRKHYYTQVLDAHVNYIKAAYEILGSYGVPKERIFISYNSPDTDEIFATKKRIEGSETEISQSPYRILHVGRLVPWKRVDLLIKALANLLPDFPDTELVVIGRGPQLEELQSLAKELNIEQKVRFVGAVYEPEILGKHFLESGIYALAGMGGLSINEAMAYGKPVVCSVCDGTEKVLVRDGKNGFFFEEGNCKSLTEQLRKLLSDTKLITKFGQESERIIREEINIDVMVQAYLSAFDFVTDNRFGLKNNR